MKRLFKFFLGIGVGLGVLLADYPVIKKEFDELSYSYDSERYRFVDKDDGRLALVRKVTYPNLPNFDHFYIKYKGSEQIIERGDFLTTNNRLVHLTRQGYSAERIN